LTTENSRVTISSADKDLKFMAQETQEGHWNEKGKV